MINMIYVMSDLNGEYEKYKAMLDKIQLRDEDTLFVLGDVIDRGNQGIRILLDMMNRENVCPISGNHEYMASCCFGWLKNGITQENMNKLKDEQVQDLADWMANGAYPTIRELTLLSRDEQDAVFEYVLNFPLYEVVYVKQQKYILVHAGLGNFNPLKELSDYTIDELVWQRPKLEKRLFDNLETFVVCGHTPTPLICGEAKIYHYHQQIFIDCGASFQGGKLGCLCLDTMEEYYID